MVSSLKAFSNILSEQSLLKRFSIVPSSGSDTETLFLLRKKNHVSFTANSLNVL